MPRLLLIILCMALTCSLTAVDMHVTDVMRTRGHIIDHGYRHLVKHAQLLFEYTASTQMTELQKIVTENLVNNTEQIYLYQGQRAGDWYLQLSLNNPQRVQAWWQAQLEQLQRVVPGIGIERQGLRLHQDGRYITIMGRLVNSLPRLVAAADDPADVIVHLSAKQQARLYISKSGMRVATRLPYEPTQARYIDHAFISALPQEMFAWSIVLVNDQTREQLLKQLDNLEPVVNTLNSRISMSALKQVLAEWQGELFIGFSNSREGFDIHIALSGNDVMDRMMSVYIQGESGVVQLDKRAFTIIRGDHRWVVSSNERIAEVLSGKRTIHFPQRLPEQISKDQKLLAAGYANTLALAQKYYEQLPALRQHHQAVGNHELGLLRESLKDMIPHFHEMVITAAHEGKEVNVEANGIGNVAVMLAGLGLCHRFGQQQKGDEAAMTAAYQQISSYVKTHRQWPRSAADIPLSPADFCYLKAEGEQLFVVPVLIENPARHAGRGSYVAFSNGEVRFYEGRSIWNRAVELRGDGGGSHWDDWTLQHEQFERVGGAVDDNDNVQIIFEQLQN